MAAHSLDHETAAAILVRAAEHSVLTPQISPSGSALPHELLAFVISADGRPLTIEHPDLIDRAGAQVARELMAEAVRLVKAQQVSIPAHPQQEIAVPVTGQPYAADRPDVRGLKLVGDPHGLRAALGPVELDTASSEAMVERDTGETYNAGQVGGLIFRLRIPALIEIARPNLVGRSAGERLDLGGSEHLTLRHVGG